MKNGRSNPTVGFWSGSRKHHTPHKGIFFKVQKGTTQFCKAAPESELSTTDGSGSTKNERRSIALVKSNFFKFTNLNTVQYINVLYILLLVLVVALMAEFELVRCQASFLFHEWGGGGRKRRLYAKILPISWLKIRIFNTHLPLTPILLSQKHVNTHHSV